MHRFAFPLMLPVLLAAEPPPSGDAVIRGKANGSEIVISTTNRLAGAIDSLRWNGQEFIDSADHGRQLQSALNADCGSRFTPETFNPTEAGSRADGAGPRSTSVLLHRVAGPNFLQTTTRMAFWLRPGEKSAGEPAKNRGPLSNHLLTKRVTIGHRGHANWLDYRVTFQVPLGERHTYLQFESLTGYMPAKFERFEKFDAAAGKLVALDDGPGEQAMPIVVSTRDGKHAMGIFSPDQPSKGFAGAGYGRFRFVPEEVVKWNCVFRLRDADGVAAGEYAFRHVVVIGDRAMVEADMAILAGK